MQTAIITNGDAFGFAPTTHQAAAVETYLTALKNLPLLRKQIDDAARRRNAQVVLDIARGLVGADACETDRDLQTRMQLFGTLVEQSRTFGDYTKALEQMETELLRAVEDIAVCSEEARCVVIERLAGWTRDTQRSQDAVDDMRRLHGLVDELLKRGRQNTYEGRTANREEALNAGSPTDSETVARSGWWGTETREQASTRTEPRTRYGAAADVSTPNSAQQADSPPSDQFASTAGGASEASTVGDAIVADATPARRQTETRRAGQADVEEGRRSGGKR